MSLSGRRTRLGALAALAAFMLAMLALLPAVAQAATRSATVTFPGTIVTPGTGSGFGQYNFTVDPAGTDAFPFVKGPKAGHCIQRNVSLDPDVNDAELLTGADVTLTQAQRVKWLLLSSRHSVASAPNATARNVEAAAHQAAIWMITDGYSGNHSNPAVKARALELFAQSQTYKGYADQAPSVVALGEAVCNGTVRTLKVTGTPFTTVTLSIDAGSTGTFSNGQGTIDVALGANGMAQVALTGTGTVAVTAEFHVATLVQVSREKKKHYYTYDKQDFAYVEFEKKYVKTTVNFIQCEDLTIEKTADTSYVREYMWELDKSVPEKFLHIVTEDDQVTIPYTIDVTRSLKEERDFKVFGTITVGNPNHLTVEAKVQDLLNPSCTVEGQSVKTVMVPPKTGVNLAYTCDVANKDAGENSAKATWTLPGLDEDSATATAPFTFGEPTTVINDSITVTDTAPEFAAKYGNPVVATETPTSYTYDRTVAVPTDIAKPCVVVDNTAEFFYPKSKKADGGDSVYVKVCRKAADLTVSKTAETSYTRTFDWAIAKNANATKITTGADTVNVTYQVDATKSAAVDSNFLVTGVITIVNSNPFPVNGVAVEDSLPGATCSVETSPVNVPAREGDVNGTVQVPYQCTLESPTDGTNTATATWTWTPAQEFALQGEGYAPPSGPQTAEGTAPVVFGDPTTTVNDAVDVMDTFDNNAPEFLGQTWVTRSFSYVRTLSVPVSACHVYQNVAHVINGESGLSIPSQPVNVEVCRETPPPPPPAPQPPAAAAAGTPAPTRAVLRVVKTGPRAARSGQLVSYRIKVTNRSRTTARNVLIRDVIPGGYTVSRRSKGATLRGGQLRWKVSRLAPGKSKTVVVRFRLSRSIKGRKCNVAFASASNARRAGNRACTRIAAVAGAVQPAVTG